MLNKLINSVIRRYHPSRLRRSLILVRFHLCVRTYSTQLELTPLRFICNDKIILYDSIFFNLSLWNLKYKTSFFLKVVIRLLATYLERNPFHTDLLRCIFSVFKNLNKVVKAIKTINGYQMVLAHFIFQVGSEDEYNPPMICVRQRNSK